MLQTTILVVLITAFGITQCKMLYQNNIPNGNSVPDPCNSGGTWAAVGHYDPKVGSALTNKFAKDFAAAGHTWTRELCMKDSDEDTYTNGQELGDPNCNWTPGNQPERAAFGHPGICQPVGQGHCHHQHFSCSCLSTCSNLQ